MNRAVHWYRATAPAAKVIVLAAVLLSATIGVLLVDGGKGARSGKGARAFEQMAGGLGLGATVRPRWCFVNFDPRLERCTCAEYPLPGGYCYCPEHRGTVSFFVAGPSVAGE